jgi:hypothetical protein
MKKVLVIAHDAGCGEILAAYVATHRAENDFYVYGAGPAARVFKREGIPFRPAPRTKEHMKALMHKNADAALVLVGTGWMTSIERDALAAAKRHGLATAVYLESWAEYRERFGYPKPGWQKNLPDEIWLGDRAALALAKKQFSGRTKLRLVPNEYFKAVVRRYRLARLKAKQDSILFLSNKDDTTKQVFSWLLECLACTEKPSRVRIRFHPADNRSRFDALIKKYKGSVHVEKSTEKDIVRDLVRTKSVIGTETTAMAVSALLGIRTVSILSAGKKSSLPFASIERRRDIRGVLSLLRF